MKTIVLMAIHNGFVAHEPKPRTVIVGQQTFTTSLNGAQNLFPIGEGLVVISCNGPMMKGMGAWGYADQTELIGLTRRAMNDPSIKGTMILGDTPGGTMAGTGDWYDEIAMHNSVKPIMWYGQDMTASAGMYAASATRKVFGNAGGIFGSVGVRTELVDASAFYEKMGVKIVPVVTGEYKAAGDESQKLTPQVEAYYQDMIDVMGEQMFAAVAKGRGISVKSVRDQQAKCFIGAQAKEQSLVDTICSLDEAIGALAKETRKGDKGRTNTARAILELASAK